MSEARRTVPARGTDGKGDFEIEELHGRLHDSVRQWYALAVAASTIAGLATFHQHGVDLVRSLMSTVMTSATATLVLSNELQDALKARSAQRDNGEG